jgi:hypothetical protein
MTTQTQPFTIIRSSPTSKSQTVKTGLSEQEARNWLESKASEAHDFSLDDLIVRAKSGETWSAVPAE